MSGINFSEAALVQAFFARLEAPANCAAAKPGTGCFAGGDLE